MHGGKSTGARTKEGLQRCQTAALTHGRRSAAVLAKRREMTAQVRMIAMKTAGVLKEVNAFLRNARKQGGKSSHEQPDA
jgi:hypothetical protein